VWRRGEARVAHERGRHAQRSDFSQRLERERCQLRGLVERHTGDDRLDILQSRFGSATTCVAFQLLDEQVSPADAVQVSAGVVHGSEPASGVVEGLLDRLECHVESVLRQRLAHSLAAPGASRLVPVRRVVNQRFPEVEEHGSQGHRPQSCRFRGQRKSGP
jgi:hypothetical protein